MSDYTRRRLVAETRQMKVGIMDHNSICAVPLSHNPMPARAAAISAIHRHDP